MNEFRLVPVDEALLVAFRTSPSAIESVVGASLGQMSDAVLKALEQTAAFLSVSETDPAWGCFLAVDDNAKQVVGTCAYKGRPSPDGTVEVAYHTFELFEGRGYATEMTNALVQRAGPLRVIAHTLPERNASCRVLEKAGFRKVSEVIDPEDGLVWQWARIPSEPS